MKPRKNKPTKGTSWDDDLAFRVWWHGPDFDNDPKPWKCTAMFLFASECQEYVASCQDRGADVVWQRVDVCGMVLATDRRVIAKCENETVESPV